MNEQTYEKMIQLRLKGMAEAYQEQQDVAGFSKWTFEERVIHNAHLSENQAYINGIKYF